MSETNSIISELKAEVSRLKKWGDSWRREAERKACPPRQYLIALEQLEKRAVEGGRKDNMSVEQLRLVMFADGSGMIDAAWRLCTDDESDQRRMVRKVFAEWSEYLAFDSLAELEQHLLITPTPPADAEEESNE